MNSDAAPGWARLRGRAQPPQTSTSTALLSVRGASVEYGPISAVRGVDIEVRAGEIVTLLGANGAGKSSLLNAIAGIVAFSAGSVSLRGEVVSGLSPERLVTKGIALVPEGRRIFPRLTVTENLRLGAAARRDGDQVAEDRTRLLDLFPVLAERPEQLAGTLSGGQQQMLAIARGLMSAPVLLLLDEPSLGLAPIVVEEEIFGLLDGLRTAGTTILVVEQNVHRALEVADRGYVLSSGAVAISGTASELRESSEVERSYLGIGGPV